MIVNAITLRLPDVAGGPVTFAVALEGACLEAPRQWQALLARAALACDRLYALGRFQEAEELDALLDDAIEWLSSVLDELAVESHDDGDFETGVEDYELDESSDEGYLDGTALVQYWEPDMVVACDDGDTRRNS